MGDGRGGPDNARRIRDAARACFARHGFHGASMSRIADEAGISVGHIYRYFENKEAVVAAIVEQDLEEAAESLGRLEGGPQVFAEAMMRAMGEIARPQIALKLEILSEAARNPKIASLMRCADARVRGYLRAALMRGCKGACAEDPQVEARVELICMLWDGVMLRRFKQDGELAPELAREATDALVRTLSAPLPSPPGPSDAWAPPVAVAR